MTAFPKPTGAKGRQIELREAGARLDTLVEAVQRGEDAEIVIMRNGQPVARLVLPRTSRRVTLGLADGLYPPMTLDDFDHDNDAIARLLTKTPIEPSP
jgi:prevent-host-death family protein